MKSTPQQVLGLVDEIRPILQGHRPEIQSAVLGELVSKFLAGHFILDESKRTVNDEETERVRLAILAEISGLALRLLPINHAIVMRNNKDRFDGRPHSEPSESDTQPG